MSASLGAGLGTLGEKALALPLDILSSAEPGGEPPTPPQDSFRLSRQSQLTLTCGFHSAGVQCWTPDPHPLLNHISAS